MFYILQQYPCIVPLLSLSLPQNRKSDSLLSQLPDTRRRYPKLGTGKCSVTPTTCSKAQFQVTHPAHLLPFLTRRKLRGGTWEKGWSANFQIKLGMLFLKIPHHLDERLKETASQLQSASRRVRDRPHRQLGLAGCQVTYPTAANRRELLAAGRHFSAEACEKIKSLL